MRAVSPPPPSDRDAASDRLTTPTWLMDPLLTASMLAALTTLLVLLCRDASRSRRGDVASPRPTQAVAPGPARLAALVAALGGPCAEARQAERRLLSMGPEVIAPLLELLVQADAQPQALRPAQQLAIEQVLSGFGLQSAWQVERALRWVHRASPAYPALQRVLAPMTAALASTHLARGEPMTHGLVASLVARCPEALELVARRPELLATPAAEALWIASLPRLCVDPDALHRLLSASPDAARALGRLLARWGQPEWRETLAAHPETASLLTPLAPIGPPLDPAQLQAIIDGAPQALCADPATLLRLAHHLDDPRVLERLIVQARACGPLAAVATRALAEAPGRPPSCDLQGILQRVLAAPQLTPEGLAHLRIVAARCPQAAARALRSAMRSEAPRVVLRAAEVLTVLPVVPHVRVFLKALGRHRYSPLEAPLSAPLLARWPQVVDAVTRAAADSDREVQIGAIELLAQHGARPQAEALVALLDAHEALGGVLLGALEALGPVAIAPLSAWVEARGDAPEAAAARRRLLLLRAACDPRHQEAP